MATLADTILSELSTKWTPGNTNSKTPVFINDKDEDRIFAAQGNASGEGEVVALIVGEGDEERASLNGANHIITTPFTITADSDVESDRDLYLTEIKRIIRAKSISGGWWEIKNNFDDDKIRDSSGILKGEQVAFV